MTNEDKPVKFLAALPPGLHKWLKVTSAQTGLGMNELLVASLERTRSEAGATNQEGDA